MINEVTWAGRKLDSLSKEELINVITKLLLVIKEYRSDENMKDLALGKVALMKESKNGKS